MCLVRWRGKKGRRGRDPPPPSAPLRSPLRFIFLGVLRGCFFCVLWKPHARRISANLTGCATSYALSYSVPACLEARLLTSIHPTSPITGAPDVVQHCYCSLDVMEWCCHPIYLPPPVVPFCARLRYKAISSILDKGLPILASALPTDATDKGHPSRSGRLINN
ncbi:hypothetical protein F5148DRAFT_467729 [Russula earlei]|uniref:Uncharacterized protein n=1 Tax=Russula earlei TaxID=71964 RepID=A0ACC0UN43_9AGAM|nr:hypothetical protein F5148DRAFT_467729 [Russula earlei]